MFQADNICFISLRKENFINHSYQINLRLVFLVHFLFIKIVNEETQSPDHTAILLWASSGSRDMDAGGRALWAFCSDRPPHLLGTWAYISIYEVVSLLPCGESGLQHFLT